MGSHLLPRFVTDPFLIGEEAKSKGTQIVSDV